MLPCLCPSLLLVEDAAEKEEEGDGDRRGSKAEYRWQPGGLQLDGKVDGEAAVFFRFRASKSRQFLRHEAADIVIGWTGIRTAADFDSLRFRL